ncbi:MAG TPA: FAD-binding oxidoreductase [Gammaproteobacteria bacterium]|nr:FAD-binding oxidoreductase [Gammaproteobacteria bacterium]
MLNLIAKAGAGFALAPCALPAGATMSTRSVVNDVHSKLNPTLVHDIVPVDSAAAVQSAILRARAEKLPVSIAGGRHAMGGQQFGTGTLNIDTRSMNRVLQLDPDRGVVEVEAGIQWPELISRLGEMQAGNEKHWSIIQKQTGADRLCLGGALGANIHGRGLELKPIIGDVESLVLVDASGEARVCSRSENPELFRLAVGGYGLFGVITSLRLRLMPRTKIQRVVELVEIDALMQRFEERIAAGYLYGDCQFSIDPKSPDYLRKGVFSCYQPVDDSVPVPSSQKVLSADDWRRLYLLSHNDPARIFDVYSSYYLGTSGQIYWSDSHQLSTYIDDYHQLVDRQTGAVFPGTEMITEVYVPRSALGALMSKLAADFRRHEVQVIYGTIRLIEKDADSFLAWARRNYACVVMNLHVEHTPQGISKSAEDFRRIIDRAIELDGSYFLTYHRWASRRQAEICYPQMARFLDLKRRYDPDEIFQSDWYRHYRRLFS